MSCRVVRFLLLQTSCSSASPAPYTKHGLFRCLWRSLLDGALAPESTAPRSPKLPCAVFWEAVTVFHTLWVQAPRRGVSPVEMFHARSYTDMGGKQPTSFINLSEKHPL